MGGADLKDDNDSRWPSLPSSRTALSGLVGNALGTSG